MLVSGTADVDAVRGPRRPRCWRSRSSRPSWSPPRGAMRSATVSAAVSVAAVRTPGRVREPPRALPLRALRGGARRAGGREGDLGAGGDRRALRRPLQPRAARRAARGRGRAEPATSASGSTGCARPARAGSSSAALVEREDELENRLLAARVTFRGEEMPLRTAQAQLAVLAAYARPRGARRDPGRGERRVQPRPARADRGGRGARRRALRHRRRRSSATRRRRGSRCASCRASLKARATPPTPSARGRAPRATGSSGCSGPSATEVPSSYHTSYMRRLSPLESTYTKERATEVCLATLTELGFDLAAATNIKLDLDDRPQKAPRACVIASDPPSVVHLITRAQGGLHDYQAFLHEAGHALHYGGVDPSLPIHVPPHLARPRADRDLLVHRRGDLARARLARPLLRPLRRAGGARTPRRPSSSRRCSSAATRRSSASSSASGRASPTTAARPRATRSSSPTRPASATAADGYLSDMDAGFYSADYLRAWIRSAQLRRHLIETVGEDWWRNAGDRRAAPRALPRGHEAVERGDRRADRLRPARHGPLLHEIGA